MDVPIERASVYRMVLRYTNPNAEPYIGEVSVVRSDGQGDAHPQAHQVMFLNDITIILLKPGKIFKKCSNMLPYDTC